MAYLTYNEYVTMFGGDATQTDFEKTEFVAERYIERLTTGVDGFNKLQNSFPNEERSVKAIKFCMNAIVDTLLSAEKVKKASVTVDDSGLVHSNIVNSISSGSESISYANAQAVGSVFDAEMMEIQIRKTVALYLSGVEDANGVFLLYMGVY